MRRVLEVIKLIDAPGAIQSFDVFTVVCEASSQHLLYLPSYLCSMSGRNIAD